MSIRDQILAANDSRLEPVEVPEWGCTVYVPVITLEDVPEVERAEGKAERLAAVIIRDAEGKRVFTDQDAPALAKKSMAAVVKVVEVFNRVNGYAKDAEKPAKN